MRDIADKFVGGIQRIDTALPVGVRGPTWRSVLIGFAGVAALSLLEPYNQNTFKNTPLIGNQFPVAVVFFIVVLVLVVNPILSLLSSRFSPSHVGPARRVFTIVRPLSPSELVVIVTMVLSACAVIWSGFHRFWAHQLVAPFYYLGSHPRWEPLVRSLPSWLVPSADPENGEIIRSFFTGGAEVPWGPWLRTSLLWSPFVLAFFVGCFFMVAFFRRQWAEAEKLSFPLAAITLEMLRPPSSGHLVNDLFRSKLFWWSLAVVVFFQMLYGLNACFPALPEVVFKYDLNPAFDAPPWRYLPPWIKAKDAFFMMVGVSFFLSTEMSFSLWVSVIILAVIEMLGKTYQYPIHEQFNDHQIGAYIAYTVVILYGARRHVARIVRSIWSGPGNGSDGVELSERAAAIGFVVCFVVACAWLRLAGLPLSLAILVAAVVFMLALVVGRVVAESGLLFVQYGCWPTRIAESCFGSSLTPATHTLIHFTTVAPTIDARESLAPFAFNSARVADGVKHLHRNRLFLLWIGALVLALVLAGYAQLSIVYRRGALQTDEYAGRFAPEILYNSSADFDSLLQQPPERVRADLTRHLRQVACGGGVVLALCFLRYRFLGWPLHPVGFLLAHSYPMRVFWLSIMLGWLCKTLVMRLGGVPVYRRLSPVFMGMIVGTAFSSVFWIAVRMFICGMGEQGRPISFLPS